MDALTIAELKRLINKRDTGILFCIGKSFISKIIQAKTRHNIDEIVPSHVALIVDGTFLYESTSQDEKLGNKTIPAGVRRYLLKDFYRIEKAEEALDIGLFDYLDSGSLCLMEWPENIEELLPEDCLKVHIEVLPDLSRRISWEER